MRTGMPVDELLKMKGRSVKDATLPPTNLGRDDEGFIVAYHYEDCDVLVRRWNNMYRVDRVKWKS